MEKWYHQDTSVFTTHPTKVLRQNFVGTFSSRGFLISMEVEGAPTMENQFSYVLVKNGPELSPGELENTAQLVCQVKIYWGNNLLHIATLTNGRSFSIGDSQECDFKVSIDKLTIVTSTDDGFLVTDTQEQNLLRRGERRKFDVQGLTFDVTVEHPAKPLGKKKSLDKGAALFSGASLLTHAALVASAFFFMPPYDPLDSRDVSYEQSLLMQQYLAASAEKEQKREETIEEQSTVGGGDTGARAKGSEGAMGSNSSSDKRYAVTGPRDNPDPHISRQRMMQDATQFGLVGVLAAMGGGDPNAPTAPWGRDDSLGTDPASSNGNLWGSEIGDGGRAGGLGLTGLGEMGGGNGEGIGVGNNIGGLGNNLQRGFDGERGIRGKHSPKGISMRPGITTTSGKIPPEVIQRVVRQNFGRFRACYEAGLKNNPSLSGRVAVRFVIDRNGGVGQTSNGGSDLPDGGVVGCVVGAFRGLSFPPPEAGIVTVGYSIQFNPS
jgi:hypothetical protein